MSSSAEYLPAHLALAKLQVSQQKLLAALKSNQARLKDIESCIQQNEQQSRYQNAIVAVSVAAITVAAANIVARAF